MNETSFPWVIAHRGASSEHPENTLSAFQRAIELGAHCLEVDVHLSKEGIPICHHNEALGPDCALISELTVKEIKERTSRKGEAPTLEQLLGLVRPTTQLMIELKSEGCHSPRKLVNAVVDLVSYYQAFFPELPLIGSFSRTILEELRRCWPAQRLVGIAQYTHELQALLPCQPSIMALHSGLVSQAQVSHLRSHDCSVWSWTVDDIPTARDLIAAGVQGIITNDPRRLLNLAGTTYPPCGY